MRLMTPAILAMAMLPLPAPAQSAPPAAACTAQDLHALDFWIGDWDVYPRAKPDRLVAHSKIEPVAGGCAIRETWLPLSGAGGTSLSMWRPDTREWRQTWVDATGSWVEFHGGMQGAAMVLTGIWAQPGKPQQTTRMTYRRIEDGAVEQSGETSDDGGVTWTPSFDFIYRPKR